MSALARQYALLTLGINVKTTRKDAMCRLGRSAPLSCPPHGSQMATSSIRGVSGCSRLSSSANTMTKKGAKLKQKRLQNFLSGRRLRTGMTRPAEQQRAKQPAEPAGLTAQGIR